MTIERIVDGSTTDPPPVLVRTTSTPAAQLAAHVLASTSNASRRTVRGRLNWIAHALGCIDAQAVPWEALQPVHTAWIATHAADTLAPDTARAVVAALRAVLMQGWRVGVWSYDEHARLGTLPPVRGSRRPRGRTLSPLDVERLCTAAGDGMRGHRDRGALALLVGGGLRRSEVVNLDAASVVEGRIVRVIGKGNRERVVPLPAWSRTLLARWVEVRGPWPGALIVPVRKSDAIECRRMTGTALYRAMLRLTDGSGVALWSPHDGRRTFASALLDASDLATVAGLLGHASTDTTRRYDLRDDSTRAAAVSRLDRWVTINGGKHG